MAGVGPFVVVGILFGLLYNTLFYPRTLVEYAEAGSIGAILGGVVGLVEELTKLPAWLQRRSIAFAVGVRTLLYSAVVAVCLSLVLSIEPATLDECAYVGCVAGYVRSPLFARDVVFSTAFTFFVTMIAQIAFLVGPRNLARLSVGRYRRPRELNAEFMFVDLRGSTALAEELGHERYSALLRDFFIDVSGAIQDARGEIYQYIGDEIVVVWPGRRAAGRWLDCFEEMRAAIDAERETYLGRYGVVPQFKAGVHGGAVTATEVGLVQRALVYHGDVLNTAARIQAMCNEAGVALLATREALASLPADRRARFRGIGEVSLRGKAGTVELHGLGEAREGTPVNISSPPEMPAVGA